MALRGRRAGKHTFRASLQNLHRFALIERGAEGYQDLFPLVLHVEQQLLSRTVKDIITSLGAIFSV